jgi:hypothetical protein
VVGQTKNVLASPEMGAQQNLDIFQLNLIYIYNLTGGREEFGAL